MKYKIIVGLLLISIASNFLRSNTVIYVKSQPETCEQEEEPARPTPRKEAKLTIEQMIEKYAEQYGTDVAFSKKVAECESHFRNVPNSEGAEYGIGPYQWIRSSWDKMCEGEIWNAEDNIKCGVKTLSEGKISHWGTSETDWGTYHCWSGMLSYAYGSENDRAKRAQTSSKTQSSKGSN